MRRSWVRTILASVMALAACSFVDRADAGKRVALVIGNDHYANIPELKKAVNDAHTMNDTLKKLGFTVLVAENQNRKGLSETLLAFDRMIEKGDTAFFFFAGHGFEIGGENYLLPIDVSSATVGQEELIRDGAIAAERIISRVQNRGAGTAIFVFDACRNNPFERGGTRALSGSGGLAAMTPPEGVFVIYSAGAKQTALDRLSHDDNNPNSVFTRNFAKTLVEPGLNLVQIAKRTQSEVRDLAQGIRHLQTPAYYDQIVGDVVLNGAPVDPNRKIDVVPAQAQQVAALPPVMTAPKLIDPLESTNAPIASFSRHNGGWTVVFSIADPALGISWRLGESGDFKETGFMDALDPRTRKRIPNSSAELDADTPTQTIYVRYIDTNGDLKGPFPIRFDPEAALVRDQRKILDMTASSWLSFREYNGLMIYYTHLVSYRCAIRQVRIGIDTTVPDKVIQLPPCDMKEPHAIPRNVSPYLKLPANTKSVSVELTFKDGSLSELRNYRR
ncbi:caspase family protein [Bradyrhizobium sp. LHD-71]|uniref:caspase family protein n=1 Tax=Bradyrhizobium sp. LHD-71 TaxID=3072141 RepID=UPI00280FCBEC|nr:caspase family protein [Bradyrhizobium sp. LHD-71]MDQ8731551.1 caspase family protein [Bradyrhizobium sp. LHD-71]